MQYPVLKKIISNQKRQSSRPIKLKNLDRVLYVRGLFNPPLEQETADGGLQKEKEQWQTLISVGVLFVFAILMLLISIVGEYGLLATGDLKQRQLDQERSLLVLKQRELLMMEEIEALKNSPSYIEALTRRELRLVREEEKVYLLPVSGIRNDRLLSHWRDGSGS